MSLTCAHAALGLLPGRQHADRRLFPSSTISFSFPVTSPSFFLYHVPLSVVLVGVCPSFPLVEIFSGAHGAARLSFQYMLLVPTHPFTVSFGQRRCAIARQRKKVVPLPIPPTTDSGWFSLNTHLTPCLFFSWRGCLYMGRPRRADRGECRCLAQDQGRRVCGATGQLVGTAYCDDRSNSFLQPRHRRLFFSCPNKSMMPR